MPRPERCCRCVETLKYATARSMSKGHTTVCPVVVALLQATSLLFSCCSSTKIRRIHRHEAHSQHVMPFLTLGLQLRSFRRSAISRHLWPSVRLQHQEIGAHSAPAFLCPREEWLIDRRACPRLPRQKRAITAVAILDQR